MSGDLTTDPIEINATSWNFYELLYKSEHAGATKQQAFLYQLTVPELIWRWKGSTGRGINSWGSLWRHEQYERWESTWSWQDTYRILLEV